MRIGSHTNFIVIHMEATSLYSLIADGQYRPFRLVVINGSRWLVQTHPCSLTATKRASIHRAIPCTLKQGLVLLVTSNLIAKVLIPVSVLVQEAALKNPSRVATWLVLDQIMETDILRQWDIPWYSDKETSTINTITISYFSVQLQIVYWRPLLWQNCLNTK